MTLAQPSPPPPLTDAPKRPTYEAQVLYVHNYRCRRCGALSTTSQLFACDPLNPNGRHMFPATDFAEHLPIQKIALDTKTTPICHLCTDTIQPVTDREAAARWADTVRRKRDEERRIAAATKAKHTPKHEPTLEDLI
jgi:hypothetical protein